jgi:hypothetical protein
VKGVLFGLATILGLAAVTPATTDRVAFVEKIWLIIAAGIAVAIAVHIG